MTEISDATLARLEDQLTWYDAKASKMQKAYKRLKTVMFVAGGLIPIAALYPYGQHIAAGLGFVVIVVEGLQQIGQYQQNWLIYRSTAEALKHQKFLYLAPAGAYADAADPHRLLAEQIESIVSQEHARWSAAQEESTRPARRDDARPVVTHV